MSQSRKELRALQSYLEGASDAFKVVGRNSAIVDSLEKSSLAVGKLANITCGSGYICKGGENCDSEHK